MHHHSILMVWHNQVCKRKLITQAECVSWSFFLGDFGCHDTGHTGNRNCLARIAAMTSKGASVHKALPCRQLNIAGWPASPIPVNHTIFLPFSHHVPTLSLWIHTPSALLSMSSHILPWRRGGDLSQHTPSHFYGFMAGTVAHNSSQ
jgi:hypothetical protein